MALLTLGTLAYQTGDLATARSRFEASVRRGQEPGYGPTWWVTYALLNLSHVAIEQGQYPSARAVLLESLSRWPELGSPTTLVRLLEASAHLAAATGHHVVAVRLAGTAGRLRESAGRPASAAERVAMERWLSPACAALSDAAAAGAWQEGRAVPPEEALQVASASLAEDGPLDPTAPRAPRG